MDQGEDLKAIDKYVHDRASEVKHKLIKLPEEKLKAFHSAYVDWQKWHNELGWWDKEFNKDTIIAARNKRDAINGILYGVSPNQGGNPDEYDWGSNLKRTEPLPKKEILGLPQEYVMPAGAFALGAFLAYYLIRKL